MTATVETFTRTPVLETLKKENIGKRVRLCGWVRTRRDSKGGFSFLAINDGSTFDNVQVLAENKLENYDTSRNEINSDGQSNLSPYISHGNISRRRIIHELLKVTRGNIVDSFDKVKNGSSGKEGSADEETKTRSVGKSAC